MGVKATSCLFVLLAACGPRRAAVGTPPAVPPGAPDGLRVTLAWSAPVDLDLYVTDPALETVYFASPRTRSGATLVRDTRCADGGPPPHFEIVRWPAPPPGRYRVGVDFLEACTRGTAEAAYRVVVDTGGERRETLGRARVAERNPVVLEFTVAPPEGSR
ncbi:MAG TPA: hypothetical protein VFD84_02440 [Candidatus Binatia bacterium]|nr:hypothetical protein [Candidatus Binatia bacterium]